MKKVNEINAMSRKYKKNTKHILRRSNARKLDAATRLHKDRIAIRYYHRVSKNMNSIKVAHISLSTLAH